MISHSLLEQEIPKHLDLDKNQAWSMDEANKHMTSPLDYSHNESNMRKKKNSPLVNRSTILFLYSKFQVCRV